MQFFVVGYLIRNDIACIFFPFYTTYAHASVTQNKNDAGRVTMDFR